MPKAKPVKRSTSKKFKVEIRRVHKPSQKKYVTTRVYVKKEAYK